MKVYVVDGVEGVELPVGVTFEVVRTTITLERGQWDPRSYVEVERVYIERTTDG